MNNSKHLNIFLEDVGHSVHCMNSIAVSLSLLSPETKVPDKLNISWKTADAKQTSIHSRRYAIKSSIVFSVESFFEYLIAISKDPLWPSNKKTFNQLAKKDDGKDRPKAERVSLFLSQFQNVEKEWNILTELLCHWRNKVVHSSSTARISKGSKKYLLEKQDYLYENFHHIDISETLDNFDKNKFTLKDITTLITFLIKSARAVDQFYTSNANDHTPEFLANLFIELQEKLSEEIKSLIGKQNELLEESKLNQKEIDLKQIELYKILHKEKDETRERKIIAWLNINYGFFNEKLTRQTATFL